MVHSSDVIFNEDTNCKNQVWPKSRKKVSFNLAPTDFEENLQVENLSTQKNYTRIFEERFIMENIWRYEINTELNIVYRLTKPLPQECFKKLVYVSTPFGY